MSHKLTIFLRRACALFLQITKYCQRAAYLSPRGNVFTRQVILTL